MVDQSSPLEGPAEQGVMGYVLDTSSTRDTESVMTRAERAVVVSKGQAFATSIKDKCLLIAGPLNPSGKRGESPEDQVRQSCLDALDYPPDPNNEREHIINVLLDSRGGSLDSAFRTVLYLSRYAKELNVYVPRRAKSASTLIAIGADHTYLSGFGELGPLDNQISHPRDPARSISALDCFSSVTHVRKFGFDTMREMLTQLFQDQNVGKIALPELLDRASQFALGTMSPMLRGVTALDFGTWARSLQISDNYARILLKSSHVEDKKARDIAMRLVYHYTHHPFPIDYKEAWEIGLEGKVELMDQKAYLGAQEVVEACHGKSFIGFISEPEYRQEKKAKKERGEPEEQEGDDRSGPQAMDNPTDH